MKILYLNKGWDHDAQASSVMHGMKCLNSDGTVDMDSYVDIEQQLFDYSMKNLTTVSMARYIIDRIFGG